MNKKTKEDETSAQWLLDNAKYLRKVEKVKKKKKRKRNKKKSKTPRSQTMKVKRSQLNKPVKRKKWRAKHTYLG